MLKLYNNSCTGQSNDTVIIAVVVPAAFVTVVILFLISVMAVLIYKYLNGTKSSCELELVVDCKNVVVNIHVPCFSGSKPSNANEEYKDENR